CFVFLLICFIRNRWNSPWRSTFWSLLSRAFSASVTRMKGARASLSFPRSGSRGFNGSLRRPWLTPAASGAAQTSSASAAARIARAARAKANRRLGRTGGLSRRSRVGRVELGEPRVVSPDVVVVGIELESLLVLLEGLGEFAGCLERNGEVVVGAGVVRLFGDRLLEAKLRLPPQSLPGDLGPEGDLGGRRFRVGVGGAAGRDGEEDDDRHGPTHSHAPAPNPGGGYYRKAFPGAKISGHRRPRDEVRVKGGR